MNNHSHRSIRAYMLARASIFSLVAGASLTFAAAPALAHGADDAADPMIGEIVVTARKRAEDILKIPVTVTALTSEDLAVRGAVSLNSIADFTPGVNVNNNNSGRSDRSNQQITLRGFVSSSVLATTTSLFIDGVPVSSPSAFTTISDPERVEVLKGPQSAYFGRNTFAGALNVVNKLPTGEWGGEVLGMVGTRDNYRVRGAVEGPLMGDVLTFRLGVDKFSKNGSYKNGFNPKETLGDQSTTSGNLLLVAKPTDNLTIKAFGLLSKDDDGAPANGFLSAYTVTDATGAVIIPGQSNCTLPGLTAAGVAHPNAFFCGRAPKLPAGRPSANTTNDSYIKNFLANPRGRLIDPDDGVKGYGLVRTYKHAHLNIDYDIGDTGFALSSLTGYNHEEYSQISDLDNVGTTAMLNNGFGPIANARTYFDFPFLIERRNRDFSQEFRLAYDNSGALRFVVGGSYLSADSQNGLGGGNGALGTVTFSSIGGKNRSKTYGAFFGLTYDLTEKLTVSVEGRYQIDKLYVDAPPGGLIAPSSAFIPAGVYAEGEVVAQDTFKKFLPRVIVNYNFNPNLMGYVSVAKGVNPGAFNASIINQTAAVQAAALNAGLKVSVDPETVTNYELGFKGKALDNRLRFTVAGYFAQWRDQINAIQITGTNPDNTTVLIVGSANTGSVDIKGVEGEFRFAVNNFLSIDGTGAITDAKINSYQGPTITQLSGITDFDGKEQPLISKYTASLGVQIGADIGALDDASWFARTDYVYKSGLWSDPANYAKTEGVHKVNARVGLRRGATSLEAFVTNVFNNKTYTSIGDQFVFNNTFAYTAYNSALVLGLPELRTFGLQLKVGF